MSNEALLALLFLFAIYDGWQIGKLRKRVDDLERQKEDAS